MSAAGNKFREFHEANPVVYHRLVTMARRIKAAGHKRYGIKTLFEALRYQRDLSIVGEKSFKLNNNYTAWYARMIERNNPELAGFFEVRSSVADQELPL